MNFFVDCSKGGHLKNILFAPPDGLFFWTKKTPKFELENRKIPVLQFLKVSELCQEKKLQLTPAHTHHKRRVIINKHGVYELPLELPNDLRF